MERITLSYYNDLAKELRRLNDEIVKITDKAGHRELTPMQVLVLDVLHKQPLNQASCGVVAKELGLGLPSVTSLIKRLAANSYVKEVDQFIDRRKRIYRITYIGISVVKRIEDNQKLLSAPEEK